ncbi:MAG TPA: helix-turn-helix domain-containing protein [Saprospiraceae bacterium]|nr:helix-turn-helix domain-containing protein [Saprospiraceae bacterium]HMQ85349.1 helix-turn-helix domain-containing protein [Saprospiraceae bacterium]
MQLADNPELQLAYEYVCYTNKNVFLTGKAGTGKTTFLHRIKRETYKRMAVVAPTGVAAINAGGMTIHSFFQMPFGPYIPGAQQDPSRQRKFTTQKIRLIKSLDLLVIDEISMVRADLLDGIDEALRRYRDPAKPFGGIQLLMIGDLHQLPPVVKDEEWDLLRMHYKTPYFFSSLALQQTEPIVVELKHIYRQSDTHFIDLLNQVRNNQMDESVLQTLNSRYDPDFQPEEKDAYIILTTHNASANQINSEKLAALKGQAFTFKAEIKGDFAAHAYPTDEALELKKGAQVMFVKNDPSWEKLYYNGKIGQISHIDEEDVVVKCPDGEEIRVIRTQWDNIKYNLDEQTKEVSEEIIGSFIQLPLRLAWAITIHKSQGLTFEKVMLDAAAAFAHGQVYVALSRCKSFEGLVLSSKIRPSSVRTDSKVKEYTKEAEDKAPDENHLIRSKAEYQQSLLQELFNLSFLKKSLERLNRLVLEHEHKLHPGTRKQLDTVADQLGPLLPVAEKFELQIRHLCRSDELPEANATLQERVKKACHWFLPKLEELTPAAEQIPVSSDNKQIRKDVGEALERLLLNLFIKTNCLREAQNGFSTSQYLRILADAELDFKVKQSHAPEPRKELLHTPNPELYTQLVAWRKEKAAELAVSLASVLPAQTILDLALKLPVSSKQLKAIPGIGKGRLKEYGEELLEMIRSYCQTKGIEMDEAGAFPEADDSKPLKVDTKALTLELYQLGKNIEDIAKERGLSISTIEGHLSHYIEKGELDILNFIPKEEIEALLEYLETHPKPLLGEMRVHFENKHSYGQLRMALAYRDWIAQGEGYE